MDLDLRNKKNLKLFLAIFVVLGLVPFFGGMTLLATYNNLLRNKGNFGFANLYSFGVFLAMHISTTYISANLFNWALQHESKKRMIPMIAAAFVSYALTFVLIVIYVFFYFLYENEKP